MAELVSRHDTLVHPGYRLFAMYDPTRDESEDFEPATRGAIAGTIGWAPSVVCVSTVLDLLPVTVTVEVWTGPPPTDETGYDLTREHRLYFPSGRCSIDASAEEAIRLGQPLRTGPGTYGVRVTGYGRVEVRRRREQVPTGPDFDAAIDALAGIERYRFQLWPINLHVHRSDEEAADEP